VSESQRLFAALELPGHERRRLAAWGRAAADADRALRALPQAGLHVTLHFLGERPATEVDGLRAALAGTPVTALDLRGTGALWLAPRRPHVLACGLRERTGALVALHEALGTALQGACADWRPDRRGGRDLIPHVTVARVRRGSRPDRSSLPPAPDLSFAPPALALMRSQLGPGGARYQTLERVPLLSGS